MDRRLEPEELDTWRTFLQAHAGVLDALRRDLEAERSLPLSWYEVLVHLARAPGGRLRMQELAARVLLTQSGVSRLVDRMEAAGLVERTSCALDRRGTYAELKPAGLETLRRATPVHFRGIDRHFLRHLEPREREALRSALGKVVAAHRPDREGASHPSTAPVSPIGS
jgi:DNA-binding MarR family transcriptional regulator